MTKTSSFSFRPFLLDMIANAVFAGVGPLHLAARNLLANLHGLPHGGVAEPAAAHVIHFSGAGMEIELMETTNQVKAVKIVAHLLAAVSVDRVFEPEAAQRMR